MAEQMSSYSTHPEPMVQMPSAPSQRKSKFALVAVLLIFIGFCVIATTIAVAYAYGEISVGDKATQEKVSDFVQSIPFMPKTPRYVLKASIAAHKKVTRFKLDASLSTNIPTLATSLGTSDIDIRISGPIDYTDPKKPILDLNAKFTKELDVDLKTKDYITYFKINKLPAMVGVYFSALGINDSIIQQFMNKWFFYDRTPLDTEARQSLDKNNDDQALTNTLIQEYFSTLDDPKIAQYLTMEKTQLNGVPVYYMKFNPSDEVLDLFWEKYTKRYAQKTDRLYKEEEEKISKSIGGFKYEGWVAQDTFYVHKASLYFVVKSSAMGSSSYGYGSVLPQKDIPVSMVVSLSDYGKQFPLEIPKDAEKFEDFMKEVLEKEASNSGSFIGGNVVRARNTRRRSDINTILNAIHQYAVDNKGSWPVGITSKEKEISSTGANICKSLVGLYLSSMPVDPSINGGTSVTSCTAPYSTGYTVKAVDGYVTVTASKAENGEQIFITR